MSEPSDPRAALNHALGGVAPPASVEKLDPTVIADLAAAIVAARRTQAAQLAASGEATLRVVPRPLRGIVRKVIGL